MKTITATQENLVRLAQLFGLTRLPYNICHEQRVAICQFAYGNQGSIRQVAKYDGALMKVALPVADRLGCSNSPIMTEYTNIILIADNLYAVSKINMPWSQTDCGWQVNLESSAKLFSKREEVLAEMDIMDSEIAQLQKKKDDLYAKLNRA